MQRSVQTAFRLGAAAAIAATALAFGGSPVAAAPGAPTLPAATCTLVGTTRTCDLWTKAGTINLPNAANTPILGYSDSASGPAQLPGPAIVANANETLVIVLHNNLTAVTSLSAPSLDAMPDLTGVAAGGTKTYTFSNLAPGTYSYEAGLTANGPRQVAMGLYGGLVVRPTGQPKQAYDASSTFDDEALLVYSEIDPAFNNTVSTTPMSQFHPQYWLINGQVAPNTTPISTQPNRKLLLRHLNAGLSDHSIGVLGLRQTIVARGGIAERYPTSVVAETIPAGTALDTIAAIPANAPLTAKYALYDTSRPSGTSVSGVQNGGSLTYITTVDTIPPVVSGVTVVPSLSNGTVALALSATASDVLTGNSNITAAEYTIDGGTATAFTIATPAPTVSLSASIPSAALTSLAAGAHTVGVRAQDAAGNWSAVVTAPFTLDKAGPSVSGLTLTPSLTNNGTIALAVSASDVATGNGNIVAAEYFIGAPTVDGSGTAVMVSAATPSASLSATIATAALAPGSYTVSVHARDAANNWGGFATATFVVDRVGPISTVTVTPNTVPAGTASVALAVTASDVASGNSNVTSASYMIDGGAATAIGGTYGTPTVTLNATIPVSGLTIGVHSVSVSATDALGNVGVAVSVPLTITAAIDTVGPATSAASVTPALTNASAVAIAASASDVATGNSAIAAAEYFIGATGANGTGIALTVSVAAPSASLSGSIPAATVNGLSAGANIVSVHSRDAAGNWGAFTTATLTIDRTVPVVSAVTVTPASIVAGTASVALTATASDTSGVGAAEYYVIPSAGTPPAVGSGIAFTGSFTNLSATVNTSGLVAGSYTVGVRARDAAGNWSAAQTTTLAVTPATTALFADSFAITTLPGGWTSVGGTAARVSATPAANLVGTSTNGLAATFATVSGNGVSGFVQRNLAATQTSLNTRFYINPANLTFGANAGTFDSFIARPALTGSAVTYRVQMRRNNGQVQVRAVVTRSGGTTATSWYQVTGSTAIETSWSQGASASFRFYTGGALRETLSGLNTSASSVQRLQLGPQGTLAGLGGTLYLDGFVATAGTLIGP